MDVPWSIGHALKNQFLHSLSLQLKQSSVLVVRFLLGKSGSAQGCDSSFPWHLVQRGNWISPQIHCPFRHHARAPRSKRTHFGVLNQLSIALALLWDLEKTSSTLITRGNITIFLSLDPFGFNKDGNAIFIAIWWAWLFPQINDFIYLSMHISIALSGHEKRQIQAKGSQFWENQSGSNSWDANPESAAPALTFFKSSLLW